METQRTEIRAHYPEAARRRIERGLRSLSQRRASTRLVHSVYWDSDRDALHAAGLALSMRPAGRRFVQTVRALGPLRAARFEVFEDRVLLSQPEPDLTRVGDPGLRERALAALGPAAPSPVLESRVRTTRRSVAWGESEVEVRFDTGALRTGDVSEPVRELGLRLRAGSPGDLFDLALVIHQSAPLRPYVRDPAERGAHLRAGGRPPAIRAIQPELDADVPLDEAIEAIVATALAQILANVEPATRGVDPEGVHQLRVGCRRLRSALTALRPVLPEGEPQRLRDGARWLAGEMGDARDLDVFRSEILGPILEVQGDDAGLKRLEMAARELQREAYERVRAALDDPRFGGFALRAGRWLATRGWRDQPLSPSAARLFAPAREYAGERLARRHQQVLRRGDALRNGSATERHALRIALKKLRYTGEAFRGVFPERKAGRWLKTVSALQDQLGQWNDLATAEGILDTLLVRMGDDATAAEARAAGFVLGWWSVRQRGGAAKLGKRWRRLADAKPFWE